MINSERLCQGKCGYVILSGTHCCGACKLHNGSHGPLCKRRKPASKDDELPSPVANAGVQKLGGANAADRTPEATSSGWYPGKHAREALQRAKEWKANVKAAKLRGEKLQMPRSPLKHLRNVMLRAKRPLRAHTGEGIGLLHMTILGGKFRTKRAYLIAELDGNEFRTPVATSDTPSWDFEMSLPVLDPSSDVRIFLFDDETARNEAARNRAQHGRRHLGHV